MMKSVKAVDQAAPPDELIAEVSKVAADVFRANELPKWCFFVGVLNALGKTFVLGSLPEYFWAYALCEWPFLLGITIWCNKRDTQLLYFAELCWVINFSGWLFLALEAINAIPGAEVWSFSSSVRITMGRIFFAFANGPLALSVVLLNNALVFHDPLRTSSFFIHFTPALV
eukprot:5365736-Prymnesium_polylepis.1